MIESRIRFYMVTLLACISVAAFTIVSFANTSVSEFTVPNNVGASSFAPLYFYYTNTDGNRDAAVASVSSSGQFSIAKPSNFASGNSCNISIHSGNVSAGAKYYGISLYNLNFAIINSSSIALLYSNDYYWYSNGSTKYSIQSKATYNFTSNSNTFNVTSIPVYHRQGDGGTNLTASDFPLTGTVNVYAGSSNYAYTYIPDPNNPQTQSEYNQAIFNNTNTIINKSDTIIETQESGFANLTSQLQDMEGDLSSSLEWMAYNLSTLSNGLPTGSTWEDSEGNEFEYPTYNQISFRLADEHVQFDTTQKCGTFLGILSRKFDELFEFFRFQFEIFFQWFYPLKDSTPQYWLVYDTDDNTGKWVNPATVTYYITWYLGQLYSQNYDDEEGALTGLTQAVNNFSTQAQNFEQAENSVINSVKSRLNDFNPDLSQIGGFRAIGWCANYLQRIYVALGAYGTVITIGLLLAVCMQFIGYFKYK